MNGSHKKIQLFTVLTDRNQHLNEMVKTGKEPDLKPPLGNMRKEFDSLTFCCASDSKIELKLFPRLELVKVSVNVSNSLRKKNRISKFFQI